MTISLTTCRQHNGPFLPLGLARYQEHIQVLSMVLLCGAGRGAGVVCNSQQSIVLTVL